MARILASTALCAGAAAMALALAAPATAEPGGKGGGGGKHESGGGPDPAAKRPSAGPQFSGDHGGKGGPRHAHQSHQGGGAERSPGRQHDRAQRGAKAQGRAAQHGPAAHERFTARGKSHGRGADRAAVPGGVVAAGAAARHGAAQRSGGEARDRFIAPGENGRQAQVSFRGERPNLLRGCPPGLAKKYNGCNPPGLVRTNHAPWQADWWGYPDQGYRYFDGYLLRTSGPSVLGYVPLLGGALFIGELWPTAYETAWVPVYYRDYYDLGPDYRYYDDAFYRLEPRTGRIVEVAGFLTGDEFVVGAPMPVGYDIYNVPWDYRDRYADGPDAWYRYADGYIYRIDPKTTLILAAIQLLT